MTHLHQRLTTSRTGESSDARNVSASSTRLDQLEQQTAQPSRNEAFHLFVQAMNVVNTIFATQRSTRLVQELIADCEQKFCEEPRTFLVFDEDLETVIDGFEVVVRDGLLVFRSRLQAKGGKSLQDYADGSAFRVRYSTLKELTNKPFYWLEHPEELDWSWFSPTVADSPTWKHA